ncbi:MAG: ABC transporter permease, partial [Acidobacteriota bacterium]
MHELTTDLKHFLRGTTRRPGFTLTVVGILATGIAAATLVFSLVHALVLDPFPFPEPDRLVLVGSEMPRAGRELGFFERFSGPELTDILAASRTLRDPLPFDLNSVRVQGREFPLRLFAAFVAADPIPTLGLAPRLGRGFSADELRRAEPVALISHELWQSELGASPDILGQPLIADGTTYEIIGVLAPFASLYGADLFLPLTEPLATMPRGSRQLNLLARVVDGQPLAAVETELEILAGGIAERHGDEHEEYCDWRLAATTWTEHNAFAYRDMALLALGAVLFVLLLVSTNLANLLLVRANAERGAMAVRAALGASRWRIVRLALIESTCLALLGGLGGVLLAHGGLATASLWLPATLAPSGPPAVVNSEILLFALAASLGSALVFGTAPALHTLRADPREALAEGSGRGTSGYGVRRVQRTLVAAQVALAIVLLTGAASLGSGLLELVQRDPGFDAEHLLSMRLSLPRTAYDGAAVPSFFAALTQDVGTLPGVEGVT